MFPQACCSSFHFHYNFSVHQTQEVRLSMSYHLPCFSASVLTGLRFLSSRCLKRLCSTSSCCSPATSIASILRSEKVVESLMIDADSRLSSASASVATYRRRACAGRQCRCWFSAYLLVTCRHTAQDEPVGSKHTLRGTISNFCPCLISWKTSELGLVGLSCA